MEEQDVKKLIDDALAGAGEQFAQQARTAAQEAIADAAAKTTASIEQLAAKIEQAASAKGVDAATLEKLVADKLEATLAARDEQAKTAAQQTAAEQALKQARDAFLAEKAAKVPEVYRGLIPASDKPEELQAGLDKAIKAMQDDAAKYGWKLPDLGASAGQQPEGDEKPAGKSKEELAAMSRQQRDAYLREVATKKD